MHEKEKYRIFTGIKACIKLYWYEYNMNKMVCLTISILARILTLLSFTSLQCIYEFYLYLVENATRLEKIVIRDLIYTVVLV